MSIMHNRDTRVATFIGGALDGKIQHFAQALTDEYTIATSRARVGDVIDVTGPVKIENEVYRLEKLFVTLNAPEPEAIFYVYVLKSMSLRDAIARLLFYYRPKKKEEEN